jgi:hypothetical protein
MALKVPNFGGIVTGKSALKLADNEAVDCSNVRLNNPKGTLNADIGMSKWSNYGAKTGSVDSAITAIHQLKNKRICILEDQYWTVDGWTGSEDFRTLGSFVALGQTSRAWTKMTLGLNGDVYACVTGGDIYKQTGGLGNFVALNQTSLRRLGMVSTIYGDIYYSVLNGDIYKATFA